MATRLRAEYLARSPWEGDAQLRLQEPPPGHTLAPQRSRSLGPASAGVGIFLAILVLAGAAPSFAAETGHDAEVIAFAMTLAVAQVASDRCPDILANTDMLRGLRGRLHIEPGDDWLLRSRCGRS